MYSVGTFGTGKPVHFTRMRGVRLSGVLIIHKIEIYVNAFGTKQSVHINVNGHFSGVSIRLGSICGGEFFCFVKNLCFEMFQVEHLPALRDPLTL